MRVHVMRVPTPMAALLEKWAPPFLKGGAREGRGGRAP